jgi:hypothetical protein
LRGDMEMKELMVKGTQTFLGKEIPVIEGGFGEDQRVVLAKTVAKIHDSKLIHVNELINKNINRFNTNDILDLKVIGGSDNNFESFGFTRMQVAKANNIYLLSERGYTKLVAMMDNKNEKKWEVMDQLIDEYFAMRKTFKEKTAITEKHLKDLEKRLEKKMRTEMETLVGGYQKITVNMQNQMMDFQKQQQDLMMNFQREIVNQIGVIVNGNNQSKKNTSSFNGGLLGISKIVEGTGTSAEKANIKLIEKGILYIDQNGDKVATDEAVALGIAENIEIKNKPGHYFAVYTTKGQKEVKKILGIEEFEQASFDNVINFKK